MKGLANLAIIGVIGVLGFVLWDFYVNPNCKRIIPLLNMGCIGPGGTAFGLGNNVGLVMDPTKIGRWLRGIQGSADKLYNRNVGEAWRQAQWRGNQPVRTYTVPPGATSGPTSPGTSQAVGPGRATTPPGSSGAPKIIPELKSRFNPEMQKQIKAGTYRQPAYVKKLIEQSKPKYTPPGRPVLKPSPLSFDNFMKALTDVFQLRTAPKNLAEYVKWLQQGFKDPKGRILESLGYKKVGDKFVPVPGFRARYVRSFY